jgi:ribosomal-protein-alanine N-acetyltransferase
MVLHPLTITAYKPRYRHDVRDLLFRSYRAHTHLDWHDTDHWLDTTDAPMRLAWSAGQLVGMIALSEPLNGTCWVRLLGIHDNVEPNGVLSMLWQPLVEELREQGVEQVALLVLRDWVVRHLDALGFHFVEDIVTLRRANRMLPTTPPLPVPIQTVSSADLEAILRIDHEAFDPPWQLTFDELRQAQRIAAFSTVATLDQKIIGYQLSTLYFDGAHLARLAVLPGLQGQGIGAALLDDLLRRLHRRGVYSTTVNTQASNVRSQRLYGRYGFVRNGYDLPMWLAAL